jgi:hypothetical protein
METCSKTAIGPCEGDADPTAYRVQVWWYGVRQLRQVPFTCHRCG